MAPPEEETGGEEEEAHAAGGGAERDGELVPPVPRRRRQRAAPRAVQAVAHRHRRRPVAILLPVGVADEGIPHYAARKKNHAIVDEPKKIGRFFFFLLEELMNLKLQPYL